MKKVLQFTMAIVAVISSVYADFPMMEIFENYQKNANSCKNIKAEEDLDVEAAVDTFKILFFQKKNEKGQRYQGREATEAEREFGRMGFVVEALRLQTQVLRQTNRLGEVSEMLKDVAQNLSSESKEYLDHLVMSAMIVDRGLKGQLSQLPSVTTSLKNIMSYLKLKKNDSYDFSNDVDELLADRNAFNSYNQFRRLYQASKMDEYDSAGFNAPLDLEYNAQTVDDLNNITEYYRMINNKSQYEYTLTLEISSDEDYSTLQSLAKKGLLKDFFKNIDVIDMTISSGDNLTEKVGNIFNHTDELLYESLYKFILTIKGIPGYIEIADIVRATPNATNFGFKLPDRAIYKSMMDFIIKNKTNVHTFTFYTSNKENEVNFKGCRTYEISDPDEKIKFKLTNMTPDSFILYDKERILTKNPTISFNDDDSDDDYSDDDDSDDDYSDDDDSDDDYSDDDDSDDDYSDEEEEEEEDSGDGYSNEEEEEEEEEEDRGDNYSNEEEEEEEEEEDRGDNYSNEEEKRLVSDSLPSLYKDIIEDIILGKEVQLCKDLNSITLTNKIKEPGETFYNDSFGYFNKPVYEFIEEFTNSEKIEYPELVPKCGTLIREIDSSS